MESKLKITIFTLATLVVTVCAVILISYYNSQPGNNQNNSNQNEPVDQRASLEIFDKSGKSLNKYDLKFRSGDSLEDAFKVISGAGIGFSYQATSDNTGDTLNTVNGVTAGSGEFWNIKVNGIDTDLGVDSLKIKDGDKIEVMLANL